jgi:two-component system CheB/CheR fusion protein
VREESVPDAEFEELLAYLKQRRGVDFTGYKRASLGRRVAKRMREVGATDHRQYVEQLEAHPTEFTELFNTILINVTSMFRDMPTWRFLQDEVLAPVLEQLPADKPIRVWSAGCSTGEEAYTLAIVLAELLGPEAFKRRVKIYGTDIDEDALQVARSATYDPSAMTAVEPDLVERYFESNAGRFSFRSDLRRSVVFGRLDLIGDAPISRLDLLACRNTLMYFNSETQDRVLERFHFALNDHGILFLGKAETLLSRNPLFSPVDRRRRIFRNTPRKGNYLSGALDVPSHVLDDTFGAWRVLTIAAFEASPLAQIVADTDGYVAAINERARYLFRLDPRDVGRPISELEISYRPVELRGPIEQANAERRPVVIRDAVHASGSDMTVFDIQVIPLRDPHGATGSCVVFEDRTRDRALEDQLRVSNQELERAYEEVQSTNEELETTNEELQSTVEELETTNEELQSTNDELHAVNDELHDRSEEVNHLNEFLRAVLASFQGGVIVVDDALQVTAWSERAEELWGLRESEVVGAPFEQIDTGLPTGQLHEALLEVMAGTASREFEIDAVTRRGRAIRCRVLVSRLRSEGRGGAILVTEPVTDAS